MAQCPFQVWAWSSTLVASSLLMPSTTLPEHDHLVADQAAILGTEEQEDEEGGNMQVLYVVQCKDPGGSQDMVELLLPRQEIRKDLLSGFERGLLPNKANHGNKKAKQVKGARQKARWLRKEEGACNKAAPAIPRQGMRKSKAQSTKREKTGGVLTAVLSCGLLAG